MTMKNQFYLSKMANQAPSLSRNCLSRSPGVSKFQSGLSQRQKSLQQAKKPPEPLVRAVTDCLSCSHHGIPSPSTSEAARTLRDYLASPSTTDMAYSVLLDHALAERDRSPAVVAKCVALLKRYLLRYIPRLYTLHQIDLFCANSIAECDSSANRRDSPWLKSANQQPGASVASGSALSPLPTSAFASGALVKSLTYVRALVDRHMPKGPRVSFQPAVFAGASNAPKQALPTLSILLSRSFSSQLNSGIVSSRESPQKKESLRASCTNISNLGTVDEEDSRYIAVNVIKWRWAGDREQQLRMPSSVTTESDGVMGLQVTRTHSFLEVGAAALLVGDVKLKARDTPGKYLDSQLVPAVELDQLLQPSTVTTATDFASVRSHLRAITASKRMKLAPHQAWEDAPVSTFRARSRPLFQYRHYSEQQPLRLTSAEVYEVIAAVCSETCATNANQMLASSRLTNHGGRPSMDVAVSVLIKLVIDMYMVDPQSAAPLTLYMLEEMLSSPRLASRVRAFDLILNLGVHAHLLEPMLNEDNTTIEEEEPFQEQDFSGGEQFDTIVKRDIKSPEKQIASSAIDGFESWLLSILYEILLLLVQTEEREETVWASALSCLLYLVCDRGKIWRNRLEGLDIRVIKVLLEISRECSWAKVLHSKLICMLTNMFYQVPGGSLGDVSDTPIFFVEQIDLLGGIDFICLEYSRANTKEEKSDLFMVLFDYVLHQLNEMCLTAGGCTYSSDEVLPLARMLTLADAPEAFYVAIKHGVEGIGGILGGSISTALSRYDSEHLNALLESITSKFDTIIGTFTHSDAEFSDMIQTTKSCEYLKKIEAGFAEADVIKKVKLSFTTLHSLLHSERSAYRRNGYIWLVELLESEISGEGEKGIWLNIKNLQQKIEITGHQDSSSGPSVPQPIWIFCGLLKSKHNFIRRGFLIVLKKLLMRCQILLDQNELQHVTTGEFVSNDHGSNRLEKANAMIDIMSSALYLVFSTTETDRINILKMCDLLFSQLCLRVHHTSTTISGSSQIGDPSCPSGNFSSTNWNHEGDNRDPLYEMNQHGEPASMAALLLRGYASIPMQLIARVPTALFYWPLIQLAGAATDDIALGVAVGSKGRGNLPGAASDIRAALLLLLIGKCTADRAAFLEVGGEEFFRGLLDDTDARVAYYASAFLLKRMMTEEPEKYQSVLHILVFKAQQSNNEKLLENPYLQMRGILQLSSDLGTQI